jgi:hypothetical protein
VLALVLVGCGASGPTSTAEHGVLVPTRSRCTLEDVPRAGHTLETLEAAEELGCAALVDGVDLARQRVVLFPALHYAARWGRAQRVGDTTEVEIVITEHCGGPAPTPMFLVAHIPADGTPVVFRRIDEPSEDCARFRRGELPPLP